MRSASKRLWLIPRSRAWTPCNRGWSARPGDRRKAISACGKRRLQAGDRKPYCGSLCEEHLFLDTSESV